MSAPHSVASAIRWRRVGAVTSTALVEARETLHHAAQLLALVGASYVPARADDSHTSTVWQEGNAALVGEVVDAPRPFRVGVEVGTLTLLFLDLASNDRAVFPLAGRTRDEALAWLRARIGDAGRDPTVLRTQLHFSISPHPTDSGVAFVRQGDELAELERWYADANALLGARRSQLSAAGEVRCWPHHFDIATLVTLREGPFDSIGIGMSPGDASYPEPYFYVGPSPRPSRALPEIDVGHWHATDWFGAVLEGSAIAREDGAVQQVALVWRFIDGAWQALTTGR